MADVIRPIDSTVQSTTQGAVVIITPVVGTKTTYDAGGVQELAIVASSTGNAIEFSNNDIQDLLKARYDDTTFYTA